MSNDIIALLRKKLALRNEVHHFEVGMIVKWKADLACTWLKSDTPETISNRLMIVVAIQGPVPNELQMQDPNPGTAVVGWATPKGYYRETAVPIFRIRPLTEVEKNEVQTKPRMAVVPIHRHSADDECESE